MKAIYKAKRSKTPLMARLMQHLAMLFESPEKKQFRRLKEFITG